jgi:hypothetical protein
MLVPCRRQFSEESVLLAIEPRHSLPPKMKALRITIPGFRFKTVTTLAMALATLLVGSMNSLLYGALSATRKVRVWY